VKEENEMADIHTIKIGSTSYDIAANKLKTARTISLTGDVTGSGSFDGSGNLSITATVADNSHKHTDHLQLTEIG
jgi:hypothetical protein